MADHIPAVRFNDGEGIDEADFNRLQQLLRAKVLERGLHLGGSLAGVHQTGHNSGEGASFIQADPRPVGYVDDHLYLPDPRAFVYSDLSINGSGDFRIDYGPQLFVQRGGAVMGTPPDGFADKGAGQFMSYMLDDDDLAHSAKARPTTNPRWDLIEVALAHGTGNSLTRDSEDASTRALTTASTDKDDLASLLSNYLEGAEAASPVYPSLTAGYSRFATVYRETGETSLNPDNVRLHAFPTRLRKETVAGHQAWWGGGADFVENVARFGSIVKSGAGGGTLLFFPRNMDEASRLVGIGISCQSFANDIAVELVRAAEDGTGTIAITSLLDIGSGTPLSTSTDGYHFAGLPELDDAAGNDLPIWGNGRTYGPLFNSRNTTPVLGRSDDRLALRISHAGDWTDADILNYVDFYYLD